MQPMSNNGLPPVFLDPLASDDEDEGPNIDGSQAPTKTPVQITTLKVDAKKATIIERLRNVPPERYLTPKHIDEIIDAGVAPEFFALAKRDIEQIKMSNNKLKADATVLTTAMYKQTGAQSSKNFRTNVQNRADFGTLEQSNTCSTVGRIISVVVSVAMLIVTIVCILL